MTHSQGFEFSDEITPHIAHSLVTIEKDNSLNLFSYLIAVPSGYPAKHGNEGNNGIQDNYGNHVMTSSRRIMGNDIMEDNPPILHKFEHQSHLY
jgi:hypothetical protein